MSTQPLALRAMARDEVEILVDWAAAEGWNPGRHDACLFHATDPEGFVAAELEGELIGGGAVVAYGRAYGFMGLFIVKPEHRGKGFGRTLWYARRDMLRARLDPEAPIGMDGVEAMEPFYREGGFITSHVNRRYTLRAARQAVAAGVVDAHDVDFEMLAAFDALHFPGPRVAFLRAWLDQPGAHARVVFDGERIRAFGMARPCGEGFKVGPLFAEEIDAASDVLRALESAVAGEPLFVDVPDANPAGTAFVQRHGMDEVFRCARMYLGTPPAVDEGRVFGITTFELG